MTGVDHVLPLEEEYSPSGGAIATVAHGLTRGLRGSGVDVRVMTVRPTAPPFDEDDLAILRTPAHASGADRALRRVRRAVGRPAPTVRDRYLDEVATLVRSRTVVVHNDPQLADRLAQDGHRVLLWLHNLLVEPEPGPMSRLDDRITPVAVSSYVRRWTAQTHGVDAARIAVVHNAVDHTVFHPPASWHRPDRLRVVIHARIDPNKGQVLAADAVALLRCRRVPVDLAIVGRVRTFGMDTRTVRRYEERLRAAARAAGAELTGHVARDRIPALLRNSDVALALPTVPEPFSLAALEAMASGCAVVAAPSGGLAEVVGDAALRVEPEPDAVATALERLAGDTELLTSLRERSTAQAAQFTWDAAVTRTLALLGRH